MRPVLFDTFCKAGGASMGYHLAGFDVVGCDIEPQKNYPFPFILGDALDVLRRLLAGERFEATDGRRYGLTGFAALAGSPPCQGYSQTRALHTNQYPKLIGPLRELFQASGLPYVIENVVGAAPHMRDPVMVCGSSFGLGVWRHRLFETSFFMMAHPCDHARCPLPLDVTGTGGPRKAGSVRTSPGGGSSRKPSSVIQAQKAMGIDWMTRRELNEAIPPAFTAFIGERLMREVSFAEAA